MATFTDRIIGTAKFNLGTYEEVEADVSATGQAMTVVLLSSVAGGIGSLGLGASSPEASRLSCRGSSGPS